MSLKTKNRQQFITRIICAFALLLLSFSHQPVALANSNASDLSAYLLPDGTLPAFCLTIDTKTGKVAKLGKCEACRLSASIAVPDAPALSERIFTPVFLEHADHQTELVVAQIFPPSAPPRAPPIS